MRVWIPTQAASQDQGHFYYTPPPQSYIPATRMYTNTHRRGKSFNHKFTFLYQKRAFKGIKSYSSHVPFYFKRLQ